ncbi:redox-regulated ATPase YchF [Candidatus Chloroploca asiatica]|uniref:Ribosome-binding ATPase YchF n=1 Tax=Candidatus Chloroploca asiatica TaxID=1506545 RepID=A0A2H3L770_9CHLR|nr:redox-regulated ATPase YchF [Candidatus Chloroploca asiatica]PDW00900.1 redox-regulated ATPase YchF [Candidatus Chloroploca asiatica]
MKIAIIGLPNSGKTTVFNALTRGTAETTAYASGQLEPNLATVKVPDNRLAVLTGMFKPKKTTFADVQYVDVAGLSGSRREGEGLPPALLNYLGTADALLHVVRTFEDSAVPHPEGSVDLMRDLQAVDLELAFADLAIIERRLQRLNAEITKMAAREKELRITERELLLRLQAGLEAEIPIRAAQMSEEEERLIRGYQFLTAKPLLLVPNVGEDQLSAPPTVTYAHPRSAVVPLCGKIEAELAQLDDEDAQTFMEDLGITTPARELVIQQSYTLLGLISFLTTGPDEVRAWTIRQQTPAVEAAGAIHSDIQRGFIRAEVVAYDDLIKAGSMTEAKKQGTVRMEGKTYIVQDGDICHFLFNV